MGDKFHLKLNTNEIPIAYKYREGKMKRTLKRGLKGTEIAKRKVEGYDSQAKLSLWCSFDCCRRREFSDDSGSGFFCGVRCRAVFNSEELFVAFCRCDHFANVLLRECIIVSQRVVSLRPVLKHGPRSLTYLRVQECQTHVQNESEC